MIDKRFSRDPDRWVHGYVAVDNHTRVRVYREYAGQWTCDSAPAPSLYPPRWTNRAERVPFAAAMRTARAILRIRPDHG